MKGFIFKKSFDSATPPLTIKFHQGKVVANNIPQPASTLPMRVLSSANTFKVEVNSTGGSCDVCSKPIFMFDTEDYEVDGAGRVTCHQCFLKRSFAQVFQYLVNRCSICAMNDVLVMEWDTGFHTTFKMCRCCMGYYIRESNQYAMSVIQQDKASENHLGSYRAQSLFDNESVEWAKEKERKDELFSVLFNEVFQL